MTSRGWQAKECQATEGSISQSFRHIVGFLESQIDFYNEQDKAHRQLRQELDMECVYQRRLDNFSRKLEEMNNQGLDAAQIHKFIEITQLSDPYLKKFEPEYHSGRSETIEKELQMRQEKHLLRLSSLNHLLTVILTTAYEALKAVCLVFCAEKNRKLEIVYPPPLEYYPQIQTTCAPNV